MAYQKLLTLALKLHERTMEGSLSWKETAAEGAYQALLDKYIVLISKVPPYEFPEEQDIHFRLLDEKGDEMESFTGDSLAGLLGGVMEQGEFHQKMSELYDAVRRTVRGTEQAVDSMLYALDGDEISLETEA